MPVALQLSGPCLSILERSLAVPWPEEGCALLLGERSGNTLHLQRIWPCRNVWRPHWCEEPQPGEPQPAEPQAEDANNAVAEDLHQAHSRADRFVVDPLELIAAQKYCRKTATVLLGVAHSHPQGAPRPSALDRRHAWPRSVVWISALASQHSPLTPNDRGAWWMSGDSRSLQPMTIDVLQTV